MHIYEHMGRIQVLWPAYIFLPQLLFMKKRHFEKCIFEDFSYVLLGVELKTMKNMHLTLNFSSLVGKIWSFLHRATEKRPAVHFNIAFSQGTHTNRAKRPATFFVHLGSRCMNKPILAPNSFILRRTNLIKTGNFFQEIVKILIFSLQGFTWCWA